MELGPQDHNRDGLLGLNSITEISIYGASRLGFYNRAPFKGPSRVAYQGSLEGYYRVFAGLARTPQVPFNNALMVR